MSNCWQNQLTLSTLWKFEKSENLTIIFISAKTTPTSTTATVNNTIIDGAAIKTNLGCLTNTSCQSVREENLLVFKLPLEVYLHVASYLDYWIHWYRLVLLASKRLTALVSHKARPGLSATDPMNEYQLQTTHLNLYLLPNLVEGSQLVTALETFCNITALDLSDCQNLRHAKELSSLYNLKSLDISGCSSLFNSWSGSSGECGRSFHPNIRTSLTRLLMNNCLADAAVAEMFGQLQNLEHLQLRHSGLNTNTMNHFVQVGSKLKFLDISHCQFFISEGKKKSTHRKFINYWNSLVNLEHLEAKGAQSRMVGPFWAVQDEITQAITDIISQRYKKLVFLDWRPTSSGPYFWHDFTSVPNLRSLAVRCLHSHLNSSPPPLLFSPLLSLPLLFSPLLFSPLLGILFNYPFWLSIRSLICFFWFRFPNFQYNQPHSSNSCHDNPIYENWSWTWTKIRSKYTWTTCSKCANFQALAYD